MPQGKLIVIDGSDSSGKATQRKLLVKKLKEKGFKVQDIVFPQYTSFYGRIISRYLKGEFGNPHEINPYLVSLLYAQDRLLARNKLNNYLKQGRIVIADRYVSANQIHQTAKITSKKEKEKFLKWLDKLEYDLHNLPHPDLVLYLYVPLKVLIKWKKKRKRQGDHKFNLKYFRKVEFQAKTLTKKYRNWRMIKCVEDTKIFSKKEIAEKIWGEVKKII
jgi:dTMP kinase